MFSKTLVLIFKMIDCGLDFHKECREVMTEDCGAVQDVDTSGQAAPPAVTVSPQVVVDTEMTDCMEGLHVSQGASPNLSNRAPSPEDGGNAVGLHRLIHFTKMDVSSDEEDGSKKGGLGSGGPSSLAGSSSSLSPSVTTGGLRVNSALSTSSSRLSQFFDTQNHIFVYTNSTKPTTCAHCKHLIWVPSKHAFKCEKCGIKCHQKCSQEVSKCMAGDDEQNLFGGWVVYRKKRDEDPKSRKRRFAKLDGLKLGFYLSEDDPKPKEVIMIGKILKLAPLTTQRHCFEIKIARSSYIVECDSSSSCETWVNTIKQVQDESSIDKSAATQQQFTEQFMVDKSSMLGSGQFGVVMNAVDRATGETCAVKVVDKKRFKGRKDEFQTELDLHRSLVHPGIIILKGIFSSETKIFLVMEKAAGGDMLDFILNQPSGFLDERRSKFLLFQVLIGTKYLHDNSITHRDLKPENVLLMTKDDYPQAKLCDFGFAKIIGESSFMMSIVGTPAYVAPEVVNHSKIHPGKGPGYSNSVDMWSLGVILYVSISGNFPFLEDEDVFEQVKHANFFYPKAHWAKVSNECKDLVRKLICIDPESRYTLDMALEHPWFNDPIMKKDLSRLEDRIGEVYLTPFYKF